MPLRYEEQKRLEESVDPNINEWNLEIDKHNKRINKLTPSRIIRNTRANYTHRAYQRTSVQTHRLADTNA
ncbi:hypothetical protein APL35_gp167 [Apis mellifera filamentous virus]|uniref:hypothetical protein n=1 Tax=Apis mellifera filamentous virus TaxID=1100043 RepID=UPI0006BD6434|nr:hypothetical protein APL35_gp167 [Apis mellifera filamentous virus]